ncbi:MAG TPA: putative LPS assembly protein LptD, partial [Longimicrobium sp.]|nr:putative LPS assembly protein LptD [Longimicrobium sp.]
MKNRAAPLLLLLLLLGMAAAAAVSPSEAAAQVIPVPGGRRPTATPRVRPNERAPGARGDTGQPRPTGGPTERDSVIDALLRLEGYVPVWYNADSADYRADDRTLRLRGSSRVERDGRVITAKDSLVYQDRRDFVTAYGQPQATDVEGEPISGDVFYYNIASGRATARGARTKITDNATWYVEGDVTREATNRIYASNSTFTSDDRAEPAYYFKADRIMIIRNRILIGRPAYLYFKNVPVMAIPFIVQDLENGRRSGFLIPQFEINDIVRTRGGRGGSRGTGREFSNIGYYWAMSPYLGLQLAARWRSQSYMAMRSNLEFNFRRRFLTGQVEGERFWETDGPGRLNLNGGARWDMNERTNVSLSLGYASSTQFERNRVVDPFRQTADLSSNFALTRRTDWGSLSLTAERRQSIANDDRTFSPRLNVNVNPITLFPNATVTVGFAGSQQSQSFGDALVRRQPPLQQRDASGTLGLSLGDFRIGSSASYNHNSRGSLAALDPALADSAQIRDSTRLLPIAGRGTDRISFSASTGYQLTLFASTRLTPSIGFSRDLVRRDTTGAAPDSMAGSYGRFVAGPPRLNIGAGLGTDLYGFFPGVGNYEAIRHHIQPIISWTYSPAVQVKDSASARTQRQVFGEFSAKTVNQITLGLTQTFEAKVRETRPVRGDSSADSASAAGNRATPAPGQARKVMLLSINTNALAYSFEPIDRFGTRFLTPDLSTNLRTDLLGGLQFTMTHSLFEQRAGVDSAGARELRRGRFSPFL